MVWAVVLWALPAMAISHSDHSGEERPQYSWEEFDAKLIGYMSLLSIPGKEESGERGIDSLFRFRSQQEEILNRLEVMEKGALGDEKKTVTRVRQQLLTRRLKNVPPCQSEEPQKVAAPLDHKRGESIYRPSAGHISSSGRDCEAALKDFKAKLEMFEKASEPGREYKNFTSYVFPPPDGLTPAFVNCCKTSPSGPVRTDAFQFQRNLVPKTENDVAAEQRAFCEKDGGTFVRKEDRDRSVKRRVLNEITIGDQTYYCLK